MKLIVWDFDGTLADTRELIEAGMAHALQQLGLPMALKEEWLQCVGLPVEVGITRTFGPLGYGVDRVLPAYRAFAHAEHEHLMKPFPGMPELLRDLESLGIPMALATSKRGLPLRRQLARFGWEAHFDPMITPDEVTHGKPHPESLEKCLAHHRLQPGDALMVGDTPFDLEMAERAGVPSVAVGHGFYGQAALAAFHPLAYAPDTATLREILLAMAEAPGEMI